MILRIPLNMFRNIVHSKYFKYKKQKIDGVAKKLDVYLSKLSPASKVKAISQSYHETLYPASKSGLSQKLSNEAENPLVGIHPSVSKKHDKTSNCVRHLVLNKLATSAGSLKKAKKTY